jgi:hypothetical protein
MYQNPKVDGSKLFKPSKTCETFELLKHENLKHGINVLTKFCIFLT